MFLMSFGNTQRRGEEEEEKELSIHKGKEELTILGSKI